MNDTRYIYEKAFINGELPAGHFEVVAAMHICLLGHRDQWRRRHQVMYALHPFRMLMFAETVLEINFSWLKAAILMHDIFEDTKITPQEAKDAGVSEKAIAIALELTRPEVEIENVQERRRIRLSNLLEKARQMSNEARIVKCLDRMDNLADGYRTFSVKKLWHYTKESIQLHRALEAGMRNDALRPMTLEALGYLKRIINAVIESSKARGDTDFQNFSVIP
jgi:(p)ppGpp synthase/HD superfamily hydrolase